MKNKILVKILVTSSLLEDSYHITIMKIDGKLNRELKVKLRLLGVSNEG